MASRIITKKGSGAPLASDLVHGELAVDTVNKRLYTENAGGTVIEVGTSPSTIDINAGTIDGTVIGGTTPAPATFTSITGTAVTQSSVDTTAGRLLKVGDYGVFSTTSMLPSGSPDDLTRNGLYYFDGTPTGAPFPSAAIEHKSRAVNFSCQFAQSRDGSRVSIRNQSSGVWSSWSEIYHTGNDSLINSTTTQKFGTSGTERMRIDSAGNVGIGTSSPNNTTHLKINTNGNGLTVQRNSITTGDYAQVGFLVSTADLVTPSAWVRGYRGSTSGQEYLTFGSSNTERMRIDSLGNVGIGTSSPSNLLHVNSGTADSGAYFESTDRYSNIGFKDSTSTGFGYVALGCDGDALRTVAGGAERMRIDSAGNLIVGSTSLIHYATSTTQGHTLFANGADAHSASGGTVGIFNRQTSDGNIVEFRKDGTIVGSISVTASTTAYNTSSDERLKENITDANDAGDKIDAIKVRQYDWKVDGSHQDYGMIAQELMTVAPEAVSGDPESDEMMGVDYSKLVPMLVKEIQSLRARVAQLEN